MKKRIAYFLVGAIALLGGLVGFTAQTRYVMPPPDAKQTFPAFSARVPTREAAATVVLFIFDGFGPALVRAAKTPNLARMAKTGASSLEMMPVFPSLSMPNHFSLSTGCYPAHHGVISNHFRDAARGVFAQRGDADWLLACEPLHQVAEEQGVRAAVFGHVAAASTRRGKLATIAEPYTDPPPTAKEQADRIIEQLALPPDRRPRLITAYVTQPDRKGHVHGPVAPETIAAAEDADVQIGRVMAQIEKMASADRAALIVTSDHGMFPATQFVSVERLLRRVDIAATVLAEGSMAHVYLDRAADKAAALAALARFDFIDVIDPQKPPADLHLGDATARARYGDVVIGLHAGAWTADSAFFPWYLRFLNFVGEGRSASSRFAGMHGYNPALVPEVRAIFYAWGSAIAPQTLQDMRTIDVHPTIAYLLGIEPGKPVDGRARTEIVAAR